MPTVQLRGVVALLGRFPALAGVDLDVEPGEVVLLQGPNGAGKSTLLRLCAGLLAPASGTAVVLGVDLATDRRSVRRHVGLVGPGTGLYDDLSVRENVTFFGRAVGAAGAEVEGALDRLGLAGRVLDTRVAMLSTGQRRRAALASMVVRRPRLWLLDEPHAGLDQEGRDVVDALVTSASAAGATVLVASHELERARRITVRTVTLGGGIVHADDRGHAAGSGQSAVAPAPVPVTASPSGADDAP